MIMGKMNKEELIEIYNKYVSINYTEENKMKYVPLPFELNNKKWKWEGKDFPRVISLLEFREYVLADNRVFDSVLSFNGDVGANGNDPEFEYLKYHSWYNYNYQDNEKYDLHHLELEKKDFDFAMLNQTIEHLYNPILALTNIYNHMAVGGIFYANVPVNSIPHDDPLHFYTGVTMMGLGMMMKVAGFDILKLGQWGNQKYLRDSHDDKVWQDYTYSNYPGLNEFGFPLTAWCWVIKTK